MNKHLQAIADIVHASDTLSPGQIETILSSLKQADRELEIVSFKLDRTEKVKRTTSILLEETIVELEEKRKAVEESKEALQKSLEELKAAQAQLIQSEKMASLGELTAGIAHEIQNPLNFVNNFSEVSKELLAEIMDAMDSGDLEDAKDIMHDVIRNLEKIHHHGKRADGIVKGMLQHSRASNGQKEPTDINALCDEYMRLAYHGLRAKDKSFNAHFETDFDVAVGELNVVPQDIGRVLLNVINNAFYAVNNKGTLEIPGFEPRVSITTSRITPGGGKNAGIRIKIRDNGDGIPEDIREKIFQPFYTTKPAGQGTGLGLSLSYDIITKGHGGSMKVNSKAGEFTEMIIFIPG